VKKLPQPKVAVKLKTPPFSLAGRKVKIKVILRNETISTYPPEEDRFLLLDVYTNKIGTGKIVIPPLALKNFYPPFKLKPNEERTFTFTLRFEEPALYRVCARVREVKVIEVKGTPKWEESPSVTSSGSTLALAGPDWQMTLEPIGAVRGDRKVLRCMSLYDVLMLMGAIGAIISAIFTILLFFRG